MKDKYDFTNSGLVVMPPVGTLNDYRSYIQNMPSEDSTELFGLYPNAEINY
jgi:dynein heavy chain, axonemal